MNSPQLSDTTRLLRRNDVERLTGLKRSTIYENMAKGLFPKPIKIGIRMVGWLEHEIEAWINSAVAASRGAGK